MPKFQGKSSHMIKRNEGYIQRGCPEHILFWAFLSWTVSSMEMSCSMSSDMVLLSNFVGLMTNTKGRIKEWKTSQVTMIGHLQPGTLYTDMQDVLCAKVSGKRCE